MQATVVSKEKMGSAWWQLILSAPQVAARLTPGQFVMARCGDLFQSYLRRPIFAMALSADLLVLHLRPSPDAGLAWLLSRQTGDKVDLLGPLGHGFPLPPTAQHICLVSDSPLITPLLGQMQRALAANLNVTLLLGAPRASQIYPLTHLPPQVEYHLATLDGSLGYRGPVTALLPDLLRWADGVYACGSRELFQALKRQTAEIRFGVPQQFLYGLIYQPLWACGVGACGGCPLETAQGYKLSCWHGPVFDLATV